MRPPDLLADDHLAAVPRSENSFRAEHGLVDKFVVMYSGNHPPSNPITTLLDAAREMVEDTRVAFVFVGGGVGKCEAAPGQRGAELA